MRHSSFTKLSWCTFCADWQWALTMHKALVCNLSILQFKIFLATICWTWLSDLQIKSWRIDFHIQQSPIFSWSDGPFVNCTSGYSILGISQISSKMSVWSCFPSTVTNLFLKWWTFCELYLWLLSILGISLISVWSCFPSTSKIQFWRHCAIAVIW